MKHHFLIAAAGLVIITGSLVSCSKKLDLQPPNSITGSEVFSTAAGAKQALAKVYSSFALTSSTGPASTDLGGIDAGTSDFVRPMNCPRMKPSVPGTTREYPIFMIWPGTLPIPFCWASTPGLCTRLRLRIHLFSRRAVSILAGRIKSTCLTISPKPAFLGRLIITK